MLTIRFFSLIREHLNVAELSVEWHEELRTVADLKEYLAESYGESWRNVLFQPNVVHAINQSVVFLDDAIQSGDEVAFFPPMTGG